jgi:hypothetical protein
MSPDAHCPGPTIEDGASTAWIVSAPSVTLNGSMPDAGSTNAESPKPMSAFALRRDACRISAQVVPTPLWDTLRLLNSSSNVST